MSELNANSWWMRVKLFLKSTRLLPAALWLWRMLRLLGSGSFRREERRRARIFREFARESGTILRYSMREARPSNDIALVASLGWTDAMKVELGLLKGLEMAGFVPVVLTYRNPLLVKYHRLAGVKRFVFWDQCMSTVPGSLAAQVVSRLRTFEELLDFELSGIRVGRFAESTALRTLRAGTFDVHSPQIRRYLLDHVTMGMAYALGAQQLVRRIRPKLAVFIERGYTPQGQFFDMCLRDEVDTITWNAAHRSNALILKRYTLANRDEHPASLSEETWGWLQRIDWTEAHRHRLSQEIRDNYASGEWYPEAGTQFNRQIEDAGAVSRRLGLEPRKKTAVIFPHILWDSTFFFGADLFPSYEDWLVETVAAACRNHHVNWVIKIHPANVVQSARGGYQEEPTELRAIHQRIGKLPPHVAVIRPESDLNTFSLFEVTDYCLTVRGTIGIEAASLGIPVLTAGTGRYDHKGFTIDSETREEYLERLARIQDLPPLTPSQRELAERFAYGVFVVRPFYLTTVAFEFHRDSGATAKTRFNVSTNEDWLQARDLLAFAQWTRNRAALDYRDPEQVAICDSVGALE